MADVSIAPAADFTPFEVRIKITTPTDIRTLATLAYSALNIDLMDYDSKQQTRELAQLIYTAIKTKAEELGISPCHHQRSPRFT